MKPTRLLSSTIVLAIAFAITVSPVSPVRAAGSSDDAESAMETAIGTLSAQNLFLAYLSIGATADGFSKKTYTAENATQLLETCKRTIGIAQDALKKLVDTGAIKGASDVKYIKDAIAAFDALALEADDFKTCIQDQSQANIDRYMHKKDDAWKKISTLLGIE